MFSKRWESPHQTKEAKLKKAAHVEIHDDEDGEGWDERDKANYKRNKQFEKLTVDTVAMKENMEKMQLAFRKAQGMDDCLYNMGGISSKLLLHCLQNSRFPMWKNLMEWEIQSNMLGGT